MAVRLGVIFRRILIAARRGRDWYCLRAGMTSYHNWLNQTIEKLDPSAAKVEGL